MDPSQDSYPSKVTGARGRGAGASSKTAAGSAWDAGCDHGGAGLCVGCVRVCRPVPRRGGERSRVPAAPVPPDTEACGPRTLHPHASAPRLPPPVLGRLCSAEEPSPRVWPRLSPAVCSFSQPLPHGSVSLLTGSVGGVAPGSLLDQVRLRHREG